jgi:gliding motility associated protien GldN
MKTLLSILFFSILFVGLNNSADSQILDSPRDAVFEKIHTVEKKPIQYTHIREADVAWQKRIWRMIDLRQKINHPFYYPETPQKEWRNFITVLMDAVREGSITPYDPLGDLGDQFLVPMTFQEIESKFTRVDTVPVLDPENPQRILRYEVVKEEIKTADVQRIKIKEDWFFDKQRSVMDVRILGICPVINYNDEDGRLIGLRDMFWVYFPEARPILAQAPVFNRVNSAERRTFDELFWKRMFGSYIYKEENVYDRTITDYASGMDALLEAERIKNELSEFEHSLWEF